MDIDSVARKLLLKPEDTFLVVDAPEDYNKALAGLLDAVDRSDHAGGRQFDLVQVFVRDCSDLETKRQPAVDAVSPGAILWITYPKQTGTIKSDINRDRTGEIMAATGWRPVTQISIDETWSAMRFRPVDEVGA